MASGLQMWDANGVLICDTSTSMFNYLGRVNIGGDGTGNTSGSINDAALSPIASNLGRFGYFLVLTGTQSSPLNTPTVSLSGTTITWSWPNNDITPSGVNDSFLLVYGMY